MQHMSQRILPDPEQHLPQIPRQLPSGEHSWKLHRLCVRVHTQLKRTLRQGNRLLSPVQWRRYLRKLPSRVLPNLRSGLHKAPRQLSQRQHLRTVPAMRQSFRALKRGYMLQTDQQLFTIQRLRRMRCMLERILPHHAKPLPDPTRQLPPDNLHGPMPPMQPQLPPRERSLPPIRVELRLIPKQHLRLVRHQLLPDQGIVLQTARPLPDCQSTV